MAKNLLINIIASDKSAAALKGVQKNLNSVKSTVFSLKGALVGIGAGAILKSFVDVGKEVESLNIRFKFLFGSAEEGRKAFDNLSKFAGKVPFSLEQISRASGNLAVVSKDANDLTRILEITGNVAAVTGLDFETTASQIQRAFSGGIAAADIFREKGIRSLLGFEEGAKVSVSETVAAFEAAFSGTGKFATATDELAQTLEGTLSMIQDTYFNFQKTVAQEFFDELKGEFGDLNKFLKDNEEQIQAYAKAIGTNLADALLLGSKAAQAAAPPLKLVAESVGGLISGFLSLPEWVQTTGVIGAVIGGRIGFGVLVSLSAIAKAIKDIADASAIDNSQAGLSKTLQEINTEIAMIQAQYQTGLIDEGTYLADLERLENYKKTLQSLMDQQLIYQDHILRIGKTEIDTQKEIQKEVEKTKNIYMGATDTIIAAQLEALKYEKEVAKQKRLEQYKLRDELDAIEKEKLKVQKDAQNELIDKTKNTLSTLSGLNRNAFRAYQAYQIAEATINAYKGATNALATYPPPYSFLVAAASVAQGLALVAQIRSQNYSGKALGGRVQAGSAYMVGEGGGPEMFVPDQNGTIIPNKDLGKTVNVNFTINAIDTRGFRSLLVNERGTIVNMINQAVTDKGREAVI